MFLISLVFKILIVALLHYTVFLCYPETGPSGKLYLIVSMLAWSGFFIVINSKFRFLKLISGALGLLFDLALFTVMLAAIAFTMPQRDGVSIIEKIEKGQFPDRISLNEELSEMKVPYEGVVKKELKGLDHGIQKAVKIIKKK